MRCLCKPEWIRATGWMSGKVIKYRFYCSRCFKRKGYIMFDIETLQEWVV